MKKEFLTLLVLFIISQFTLTGQVPDTIILPGPVTSGGMPLYDALNNRKSARTFIEKELNQRVLSNLLWAGFGINRPDGRRTAPSAKNWQEIDIYLITKGGWYIYEPFKHALIKGGDDDLRQYAGVQEYVRTAPLNLIYVADFDRMTDTDDDNRTFCSAADAAFIAQNIYLFCASEGMATVVRGLVDKDKLREVFRLHPRQHAILGQSVGYPAE